MAKPNAYLAKQQAIQQKCFVVGCDITAQQFFDLICVVLNDPEVMGKDVFGAGRLQKLHDALKEAEKLYELAWLNETDSDYWQEKLDGRLREIFGQIEPFKQRYPFLKEWNYNKPSRK
jgi:hypothetical protein